ncbi:glucosamine-6-phosphate deaminase NagB-II [Marinibactrum halimedae]|uniref:Glutamine--fructose-6-phosphate aminotransferase n=1 Tax=Marinibactrum halimedae TaxID=1444977 RepID=A0AA37WMH7_9GAMM|nr:SIS domain-containing protein [Marinibactrum halimedae]MCD9460714.1 SIS domain-containing protein [Marinibactrum halimedae]GLS25161.1 glutamine--fructose-6-phosphate aminotransferase [Marinibactrum halimedae]
MTESTYTSVMAKEAQETPTVFSRQYTNNAQHMEALVTEIRKFDPKFVYIVGRGSSDHAGVFAKYFIEVELGIPVVAAAPSVSGVYHQQLKLKGGLAIVISQSGRSPDIVNGIEMAKQAGALCVALVNDPNSPAASKADHVIPLHAGEELAVAATKSYLATLSAIAHLVASWSGNLALLEQLKTLPSLVENAIAAPAQFQRLAFGEHKHCVVLGRGFGYAIAREIALKLKEVCSIQAEAFSSAEFIHGPVTLAEQGLLVIDVSIGDESSKAHKEQIIDIQKRGAEVIHLHAPGENSPEESLPKRLSPLLLMQRFYLDLEAMAQSMNMNPDAPAGLKKVTMTH